MIEEKWWMSQDHWHDRLYDVLHGMDFTPSMMSVFDP